MNDLSALCLRRLGFDPANLSPDEQLQRLPEITAALQAQASEAGAMVRVIQKFASNQLDKRRGSVIPNPGIVRSESVSRPDAGVENSVFDSLIPWGA